MSATASHAAVSSLDADFARALRMFWHPVCTLAELHESAAGVLALTLLGESIAVGRLPDGTAIALADRCPHRSTRLSVGHLDGATLRCAYHGWRFDTGGRCVDIPAMPEGPIPARACTRSYSAQVAYGLVWVRLEDRMHTDVPPCSAWITTTEPDPTLRVLDGAPYTWPVGAPRRVENFVDLAHFAWVHDGSLGRRDQPVPPLPTIERVDGRLEFRYESPEMDADGRALFGSQHYRMPVPLTVEINFRQRDGARRILWMTASPISLTETRCFWFVARSDALDEPDADHLAFQARILEEDEPVVCNQVPPELSLEPTAEVSVRTDRVSIEYRRFLRDLALSVDDPIAFHTHLGAGVPVGAS